MLKNLENRPFIFGHGNKKVTVLSHITSQKSEVKVIENYLDQLKSKYTFYIFDSLEGVSKSSTFTNHVSNIGKIIDVESSELFLGFSFGGCILNEFANREILPRKSKIFNVSSPSLIDNILKLKIEKIITYLIEGNLEFAIIELRKYVQSAFEKESAGLIFSKSEIKLGILRLLEGFKMILEINPLGKKIQINYNILNIYGQNSLLVQKHNIAPTLQPVGVKNAGMRVFEENLEFCLKTLMEHYER